MQSARLMVVGSLLEPVRPLDMDTVLESVTSTRRVLVVEGESATAGRGDEVLARVTEALLGG